MEKVYSNSMRNLKISVMSLLIIGACGAVVYNVLALQDPKHRLPGSTAVNVQVDDLEVSEVSAQEDISSIGQLLGRSQYQPAARQKNPLTASIQDQLSHLGFYSGASDGQNGPQTSAAIKKYQQQNAMQATGQVTARLLEQLKFSRKISEAGDVTGSIKSAAIVDPHTLEVQNKLAAYGYSPGKADGVMGRSTRKAIRQFETDRSLPATGSITPALLQELGI